MTIWQLQSILACFPYNSTLASPVQMRPSLPNPPSAPPPDCATAHPPPAASAIMPQLPQQAASSGPSAMQMTSQQHHAHITHTVTAVSPSDDLHVAQAVPQRRGHKRRALSTVAASQITRRVRQRSGLSHASSHVDHQPRPSSAVPRAVASVVCSLSCDVTPSLIGGPSALGALFDPGG